MTYCETCSEIEGDTEEVDGVVVCVHCGEEITRLPEHDDSDMER